MKTPKITGPAILDLRKANPEALSVRDKILRTAILLFNEQGVHTVGIDRIIAESGVAKMSFYKYFPSKDDLISAFLEYRDRVQFERLHRYTVEKTDDPRKQILGVFDALEEWFREGDFRGCAFTRGLFEFSHDPKSQNYKQVQKHFSRWSQFIGEPLNKLMTARKAEIALPQILSLIVGSIVMASAGVDPSVAQINKKLADNLILGASKDV
jgi:AcrR family transcriptional regulator